MRSIISWLYCCVVISHLAEWSCHSQHIITRVVLAQFANLVLGNIGLVILAGESLKVTACPMHRSPCL